ncbi:MAG: hypothetical protein AAGD22_00455, partial [Verrucomicrobiota bacterium]
RAQQQMSEVRLNTDKYLANLQSLISKKKANVQELDEFFKSSRKVLNIHQEIMRLQENQPPPKPSPTIQP